MKTYTLNGRLFSEQPLATCSKDLNDREGGPGKPIPVPSTTTCDGSRLYFPATGLRGKLRRCSRDVIREHLIAATGNPTPFTLDQHYLLTLGGIKGSAAADKASVAAEAYWRRQNPLLSVFGAGDAGALGFMAGHLSVGNAICQDPVQPVVFSGARTDEFYRDRDQAQFLSGSDLDALVRRSEGNRDASSLKKDLKKAEADLKKAKAARNDEAAQQASEVIARLDAEIAGVQKDTGTGDVSVGMPLAGWRAIPQGQVMDHRMHLLRSSEVELGLLLASLNRFAQAPLLGAHVASGCGLVSGEWEVAEVTAAGRQSLGMIRLQPFDRLVIEGDALQAALDAFTAFLAAGGDFRIPTSEIPSHA